MCIVILDCSISCLTRHIGVSMQSVSCNLVNPSLAPRNEDSAMHACIHPYRCKYTHVQNYFIKT